MRRRRQEKMWRQVKHEMSKAARRVEHIAASLAQAGDVQPAIAKTGRATLRCTLCGKVCYRDREDAEKAVAKIPDPMTAYFQPKCGWWHLATQRPNTGRQ